MARAEDVRALEDSCPWDRPDFRADLARLSGSTAAAARAYAADVRVLARLVAQVPRCPNDETGSTPWTSFRREVAVARRISDQAAAAEVRAAVRLVTALPRTLGLLEDGTLTVPRAQALVREVEVLDDALAARVDAEVAGLAVHLSVPRIVDEVRRAALRLDPESAALRTATKNAARGVAFASDRDDQASVCLYGPAVPLTRWYAGLDQQARALKQAGDGRTLDNLRFDLATSTSPCATHRPADATAPGPATDPAEEDEDGSVPAPTAAEPAAAGTRPSFVEPAPADCRRSRPVQAHVVVPVETALGLSNEPAWLDGYGWLSAPTTRTLLVDAELRRLCAQTGTGALVDVDRRDRRPPPSPEGVRRALLEMVLPPIECSDVGWRTEPQHDPSPALRDYVTLRDRGCDGPTAVTVPARRCQLDHETPHPDGPTAAWNLTARSTRTHQLKHGGWTPLRTATATTWISPSGQLVTVPRRTTRPPGVDDGADGAAPALPDPQELAAVDGAQLSAPDDDDLPPWPPDADEPGAWTWLSGSEPAPF